MHATDLRNAGLQNSDNIMHNSFSCGYPRNPMSHPVASSTVNLSFLGTNPTHISLTEATGRLWESGMGLNLRSCGGVSLFLHMGSSIGDGLISAAIENSYIKLWSFDWFNDFFPIWWSSNYVIKPSPKEPLYSRSCFLFLVHKPLGKRGADAGLSPSSERVGSKKMGKKLGQNSA